MPHAKNKGRESHEVQSHRHTEVVYARKTSARRVFMEDLAEYREEKDTRLMNDMVDSIGPTWYQALSVPQRNALDTLEFSIYQDVLEGLPNRTKKVMKLLGIHPAPDDDDLMDCVYSGRKDAKEMLSHLFLQNYGHAIDGKPGSYDLNGRLMLSAILYLGQDHLIELLEERFKPDEPEKEAKPKLKRKSDTSLESPYLTKLIAHLYTPEKSEKKLPPPLPKDLDELNEPYEEKPPLPKPLPPPPPPPPPKKRLPRSYCDQVAGVIPLTPALPAPPIDSLVQSHLHSSKHKLRTLRMSKSDNKKVFGMASTRPASQLGSRSRRPPVPSTGLDCTQFTINGVYKIQGRTVFVLGNVVKLPPDGDLIHGGHARLKDGEHINIHCGFRGKTPVPKPDPCDCMMKWADTVFQYVRKTKCHCGHYYDYGNEGSVAPEECPLFEKPTRHLPYQFNYHNIYDTDPKNIHIQTEIKKLWENDSMLHVDDGTQEKKKIKKKKRDSATCLGENPTPEDYLRCALRRMRPTEVAAWLPDIHRVPELVEWMRHRMYGSLTHMEKAQMMDKSNARWAMFTRFALKGIPHVPVPKLDEFYGKSDWSRKQKLNNKFKKFVHQYRLNMFKTHAEQANLLWPTMFQAKTPDKKFREIYFSYLFGSIDDVQVMHPYSSVEAMRRYATIVKRPYRCKPAGVENLN